MGAERLTARDRNRARRKRGYRFSALLVLFVSAALVAHDVSRANDPTPVTPRAHRPGPAAASYAGSTPPTSQVSATSQASLSSQAFPTDGPGTFTFATSQGALAGRSGVLHTYRVAVEDGVGVEPDAFAAAVDVILGDPRGWTAGGDLRLQRVPGGAAAEFAIYLATPATSQRLCRTEWMETEQYTNCRLSDGRVVINLARWLTAVPGYGAAVEVYQTYAVNHEVGHQLGHGHELCPGPGLPAPVMQQQTLGLQGCVANGWPYVDGLPYRGQPASQ